LIKRFFSERKDGFSFPETHPFQKRKVFFYPLYCPLVIISGFCGAKNGNYTRVFVKGLGVQGEGKETFCKKFLPFPLRHQTQSTTSASTTPSSFFLPESAAAP
jgi:hypothetical protein